MTIVSRISTYSLQQRTVSDFTRVQAELANLQNQISSGIKADTFDELIGDVEQFTALEAEIKKFTTYENNNTENISRFNTARNAISQSIEITDQMQNLITLRRNGSLEDNISFTQQLTDLRDSLIREMNTTFGGRFLFGGTRSNVPPVITDPLPNPVQVGVSDDTYYQGSRENLIVRPQSGFDIEFDVRADDQAFQDTMAAIALALEGHAEDDEEKVANSFDLITEGLDGLIQLQARVDSRIINLEDINDRHISLRTYFQGVKEEIINTDILSASTKVAIDETILQATFQSYARITSLNLTDFLN